MNMATLQLLLEMFGAWTFNFCFSKDCSQGGVYMEAGYVPGLDNPPNGSDHKDILRPKSIEKSGFKQ